MATPSASVLNANFGASAVDNVINDFIFVQDCRVGGGTQINVSKALVATYNQLIAVIRKVKC